MLCAAINDNTPWPRKNISYSLATGKLPGDVCARWDRPRGHGTGLSIVVCRIDGEIAPAGGKWTVDEERRRQAVLEGLFAEFDQHLAALQAPDAAVRFDVAMSANGNVKYRSKAADLMAPIPTPLPSVTLSLAQS
jgi:hypothetical protein